MNLSPQTQVLVTRGLAAMKQGNLRAALPDLEAAAHASPTVPELWGNLAQTQLLLGMRAEAAEASRRMLALKADPQARFILAVALQGQGFVEEALDVLRQAIAEAPAQSEYRYNLLLWECDLTPLPDWITVLQNGLKDLQLQAHEAVNVYVNLAIAQWYRRASQQVLTETLINISKLLMQHDALLKADPTTLTPRDLSLRQLMKNAFAFASMFRQLLRQPPAPATNPDLPPLVVIGDSHTLAPLGQTVPWHGATYQLDARLCMGIKAWHISNPQGNFQQAMFWRQWAMLPPHVPVLVSVGEIDCRTGEGMWPRIAAGRATANEIAAATFTPLLDALHARRNDHPVIIAGIPYPHTLPLQDVGAENQGAFLALLEESNRVLREGAKARGFDFLDLWHATMPPADAPDARPWHLESIHLTPAAVPHAFTEHLLKA